MSSATPAFVFALYYAIAVFPDESSTAFRTRRNNDDACNVAARVILKRTMKNVQSASDTVFFFFNIGRFGRSVDGHSNRNGLFLKPVELFPFKPPVDSTRPVRLLSGRPTRSIPFDKSSARFARIIDNRCTWRLSTERTRNM